MFDHQCDAILSLTWQEAERLGNKKGKATEAALPWEGGARLTVGQARKLSECIFSSHRFIEVETL
ncbi:hypothetical protein CGJ62_02315 [Vibrio parahaemolyticus]|nr:hypothetical protein CGJ62_02315 [Vibrio parahaemolyticus]